MPVRRGFRFGLWALPAALAVWTSASDLYAADPSQKIVPAGELTLAGQKLTCNDIPTLMSDTFWDYGGSAKSIIILNPKKLAPLPRAVQLYVYMHECGHQIYGRSEIKADCYGIRRGVREGWLTRPGVTEICKFFAKHPGDSVHPPGPDRCIYMTRCYNLEAPR